MKTADLLDKYPQARCCEPVFQRYGGNPRFSGKIRTIEAFEDFTQVKALLSEKSDGNVLVVDAGGSMRCAMLGDLLAQMAVDNGWAGCILNGAIRDSADINQMPFGVRALGTMPLRSAKDGQGSVDVPVNFAGVNFSPGDYIYADEDGIIVSSDPLELP